MVLIAFFFFPPVVAIADETTKEISKLIAKQRISSKARSAAKKASAAAFRKQQSFSLRGRTPALPAAVKKELQELLSSSPLLLLDFNNAYSRRFGRTFQYTQYGFLSMFEVLRSVSDIIVVKQTRGGSLLTLKESSSSDTEQEKMPQGEAVLFNLKRSSRKHHGQAAMSQVDVAAFLVAVVVPVPLQLSAEGLWGAAEVVVTRELSQ